MIFSYSFPSYYDILYKFVCIFLLLCCLSTQQPFIHFAFFLAAVFPCRMIRCYNFRNLFSDMFVICIRHFHQRLKVLQKTFHLERNRASDMDQIIRSFLQPLFCHQLFFIKFLSRSQSGVFYLNVNIRFLVLTT